MSTRDVEWDDDERAYMQALAWWEDTQVCPACGGPVDECQDPESEGRWRGVPPTRCHRTDEIIRYQEQDTSRPRPQALLWRAERR